MSSKSFRTTAATLLLATLVSLTAAVPARAFGPVGHVGRAGRSFEGPALTGPRSGFVAFLLRIFDFAGGAMDPNGHS
jgi:hypothetical protein